MSSEWQKRSFTLPLVADVVNLLESAGALLDTVASVSDKVGAFLEIVGPLLSLGVPSRLALDTSTVVKPIQQKLAELESQRLEYWYHLPSVDEVVNEDFLFETWVGLLMQQMRCYHEQALDKALSDIGSTLGLDMAKKNPASIERALQFGGVYSGFALIISLKDENQLQGFNKYFPHSPEFAYPYNFILNPNKLAYPVEYAKSPNIIPFGRLISPVTRLLKVSNVAGGSLIQSDTLGESIGRLGTGLRDKAAALHLLSLDIEQLALEINFFTQSFTPNIIVFEDVQGIDALQKLLINAPGAPLEQPSGGCINLCTSETISIIKALL